MDKATFGPQEVNDTFRFIEPVNRWLGGSRAILSFFIAVFICIVLAVDVYRLPPVESPSIVLVDHSVS